MKVVFLADAISEQKAGIHYYAIQLIQHIVKSYPNHNYIAISTGEIGISGVRNVVIPINPQIPFHYRFRQFTSIPSFVKNQNADIVIELAHFGPFLLPKRIKRITIIHDLGPLTHKEFHSFSSYIVHKLLLKKILKDADEIIVNSNTTKKSIADYYGQFSSKIQVCYPKVSIDQIHKTKLTKEVPYFLSIGTVEPRKNYTTLLEAFKVYRDRGGTFRLVIIGEDGWKNSKFKNYYENHPYHDDILLTGYIGRKELLDYLANCQALISTSYFEGFGLPVYEAMQMNKILILSKIAVYLEIAGRCGIFFNPDDAVELSNCLLGYSDFKKSNIADLNALEEKPLYIKSLS